MDRKTAARSRHGDAPSFLANFANCLQGQLKDLSDPYRPELHCMRGPGPKWHAKHDSTTEDFMFEKRHHTFGSGKSENSKVNSRNQ
jgi:hypothetical protein